jgi:hypothetical protein
MKKTTKAKSLAALQLRKKALAPGKRATVATKTGFDSCIVLAPEGVGAKGGLAFAVALRVGPAAGKVSFVPRGKETLVIDAAATPSTSAIQAFLRKTWDKKGGDPPTVIDRTANGIG